MVEVDPGKVGVSFLSFTRTSVFLARVREHNRGRFEERLDF